MWLFCPTTRRIRPISINPDINTTVSTKHTMPKTTVNKTTSTTTDQDGNTREIQQYRTTVPKGLAEAFDLDGVRLEWEVASGNKFEVTIVDE